MRDRTIDYRPAVIMAMNMKDDHAMYYLYKEEKDIWETTVLDTFGWTKVNLEGSFVRSCYKWLKKGGKNGWCKRMVY